MVARIFSSVDFPVPLPPTTPTRSLGVMSQSRPSNRSLWPNRFPAPESWIIGLLLFHHGDTEKGLGLEKLSPCLPGEVISAYRDLESPRDSHVYARGYWL